MRFFQAILKDPTPRVPVRSTPDIAAAERLAAQAEADGAAGAREAARSSGGDRETDAPKVARCGSDAVEAPEATPPPGAPQAGRRSQGAEGAGTQREEAREAARATQEAGRRGGVGSASKVLGFFGSPQNLRTVDICVRLPL